MNWKQCALACLFFSGYAAASGLQVTPITLTLEQSQRAEGIWLSNSGDSPINAQVRVSGARAATAISLPPRRGW